MMKHGFLGMGNMGGAIVRALLQVDKRAAASIWVAERAPERLDEARQLGLSIATSVQQLCDECDTVWLCVKPQIAASALEPLAGRNISTTLFVSVMAGRTCGWLTNILGDGCRIVRVMPNTPLLVGIGASGVFANAKCSRSDVETVSVMLQQAGSVVTVVDDEALIDTITGTSGSGPAYVFALMDGLVAGAVSNGLAEAEARKLVVQTVIGAGRLAESREQTSLSQLRREVTSPGGTTEAALNMLTSKHWIQHAADAVSVAAKRSRELAEQ